jgi:hypothetical protein
MVRPSTHSTAAGAEGLIRGTGELSSCTDLVLTGEGERARNLDLNLSVFKTDLVRAERDEEEGG